MESVKLKEKPIIASQQSSPDQMDAVLEAALEGAMIVDKGGKIKKANTAGAKILKYPLGMLQTLTVENIISVSVGAPEAKVSPISGRIEVQELDLGLGQIFALCGDGKEIKLELSLRQIDYQGEDCRLIFFRDISAQEKLAKSIEASKAAVDAARGAWLRFIANLSHEMRTPLTAILGFAEILLLQSAEDLGEEGFREYVCEIAAGGNHLLELVNSILTYAKADSGTLLLFEEDVNVEKEVAEVLSFLNGSVADKQIKLECQLDKGLPVLRGEALKVRQILLNILSNAVKYTEHGGEVALKIWSSADAGYLFEVKDNGVGISPEQMEKVYEPFQQTDAGLKKPNSGMGLGVAITKALVELHGGAIDIQSAVNEGTTVTVRFPATRIVRD